MILSGEAIRERLENGQIFREGSWDEDSLKEASYALRIAADGLMIDDKQYNPGNCYPGDYIEIEPGRIAILSTIELLNMPEDLVGKIGIRFDYAIQGLTGLMGIQVDPLYGCNDDEERLFIRVANLGNESIKLSPGDKVFTFELHGISGNVVQPSEKKSSTWLRLRHGLAHQRNSSWSNITQVQDDLSTETENISQYLQPLVMFGVFLVAVTILGVVVSLILSVRDVPEVSVPSWVKNWGWMLLLVTLSVASLATAWVGFSAGIRLLWPVRSRFSRRRRY